MNKAQKLFIKDCGLLIKNVVFIDEPITTTEQYHILYKPSGGSYSGDGYCIFFKAISQRSGTMYPFPPEIEDEVFKLDPL